LFCWFRAIGDKQQTFRIMDSPKPIDSAIA
jgi:hypothetical protein